MHICRGGGGGCGGAWIHREGSYDAIAERLYGKLNFRRFLLDYDSDAAGGFDSLRYVSADKVAVLGLVSNHGQLTVTALPSLGAWRYTAPISESPQPDSCH